jgi:hypothetical protein
MPHGGTVKRFIFALAGSLLLGGTVLFSMAPEQGKSKKHAKQEHRKHDKDDAPDAKVAVHLVFASGDVTVIRTHYEPRYRHLPKGLQKKVARGGQLPPGWQKKFEPFPVAVERRLASLPAGYRRGVFDGHAVIVDSRTNIIVDLAVLF